jgi:hypothetical protein
MRGRVEASGCRAGHEEGFDSGMPAVLLILGMIPSMNYPYARLTNTYTDKGQNFVFLFCIFYRF